MSVFPIVTGSIAESGEQNVFTFDGLVGQRIYFDSLNQSFEGLRVTLISPSGIELFNIADSSDAGPLTLQEFGTYQLVFEGIGDGIGDYNFELINIDSTAVLAFGTSVIGTLSQGVESDLFTFSGTAGQRLQFDNISADGSAVWRLTGPGGQQIANAFITADFEVILPGDGEYILVIDGAGNSDLNYEFQVNDLSVPPVPNTGFGIVQSGTITAGSSDVFSFDASAGTLIYFDSQDPDSDSVVYELRDPDGNIVSFLNGIRASSDSEIILLESTGAASTGNPYQLTVRGSNVNSTGDYQFQLLSLQDNATPLALDTITSPTLSPNSSTQVFSFSGTAGQRLYFDGLDNDGESITAQLISPSNVNIDSFGVAFGADRPPFSLNETGTYYLLLDGNGNSSTATFDYSFRLANIDAAPPLTLDSAITGTLDPGLESELFTFTGTAGQRLFFDGMTGSGANWLLYGPGNQFIASSGLSNNFEVELPGDGEYVLVLDGNNSSTPISYEFEVVTSTVTTTALTLGSDVTSTISEPGEQDIYTFSGTTGQRLFYDALITGTFFIDAELLSPSGERVFFINSNSDTNDAFNELITLTETGTYQLVIDGSGDTTGDYSFRLSDVATATALALDTTITGDLTPGLESDLFTFSGTGGQQVFFDGIQGSSARAFLYGPGGQLVTSTGFSLTSDFEVTLPTSGDYVLILDGNNSSVPISYEFEVVTSAVTTTALTLGSDVTSTISEPGEQDIYTFSGTAGQQLFYDALITGTFFIDAELLSPSGERVFFINSNSDTNDAFNELITLTETGTYQLVIDGSGDTTGDYSFRLSDVATATALALDTTITGDLTPGLESDLFTFSGTGGQQVFFDGIQGANTRVLLYGPGGQLVTSTGFSLTSDFEVTLPTSGDYVLILDGNNSSVPISYEFEVVTSAVTTTALTLGSDVTSTISEPGEQDIYTFSGTAGQQLFYDALITGTFFIDAELLSPSGERVFFINSNSDTNDAFNELITLTETGTYQLVIDGSGDTTGDYSFRLSDVATATALALDTTITGDLTPGLESDLFTFSGTGGQQVFFDGIQGSSARAFLYGPGGQLVTSTGFSLTSDFEVTLPTSGDYVLILDGNNSSVPISYEFEVVTSAVTTTALTLGSDVTSTISEPGEQDIYTFSGTAGQQLFYDALITGTFFIDAELLSPSGERVFFINSNSDTNDAFNELITLTETGTYQLVIDGSGDTTGDYSFRLSDVATATALALDTTITGDLTPGLESDLFTFSGTGGQQVFFDGIQGANTRVLLYGPGGQLVTNTGFSLTSDFEVTLPSSGDYVLVLDGNNSNTPINYEFQVNALSVPVVPNTGFGIVQSGTITAGSSDVFSLDASAGTLIYFDSQDPDFDSVVYELRDPNGNTVSLLNASSDSGVILLESTGAASTGNPYQLTVRGSNVNSTGDYQFQLLSLQDNATPLALDTITSPTLSPNSSTQVFSFSGTAGQRLYFDGLDNDGESITAQLISPSNVNIDSFGVAFGADRPPFSLNETGTYYLLLDGNGNSSTATFDYSFRLANIDAAPPLTLDSAITGTLDPGLESELFTFTGTAGQRLFFDGMTGSGANWLLYGPGNQFIASSGLSNNFEVELPGDGEYVLVLDGNNSSTPISYEFEVVTSTVTTTALTLGSDVTSTISEPGEQDIYTFSGTTGQRLFYDALITGTGAIDAELLSPSGERVFFINSNSDTGDFNELITLTETGTYQLVVDGSGDTTGDYSFRLSDVATATALSFDTSITGQLNPGLETDLFRFTGTQGQQLFFDGISGSSAAWELYGPGGSFIGGTSASLTGNFEIELPGDGEYILVLDGQNNSAPINYEFQVVTSTVTTTALTLGNDVTSTISEPGEQDIYTFSGTSGQRLFYDSLITGTAAIDAELLSPSGERIFFINSNSDTGDFNELITLTETGTYQLVVDGSGDTTGDYSFRLSDVATATALSFDTSITGQLNPGLETDLFRFTGTQGQQLFFDGISGSSAFWELYGPGGSFISGTFASLTSNFEIELPGDGEYLLVLDGQNTSAPHQL